MNLADWVQLVCCPLTVAGVLGLLYVQRKESREWHRRLLALERPQNPGGGSMPVYTYETTTATDPRCRCQGDPGQPEPS